jgi:TRAP-type mannitol/chloroaromatic compound transport system substrate-binding protein
MKFLLNHRTTLIIVFFVLILIVPVAACNMSNAQPQTIKWRMATSWTKDNLIYTEGAQAICQKVQKLSGGRLQIEALPVDTSRISGVFDMVSQGKVECGHSWPGYSMDKEPAFVLFSSIPDMMTMQEWAVWLYGPSRGIDLWHELYAKYNAVPFPGALDGPELGFFTNKPLRNLNDFKGMRLRTPGMAAKVLSELGATPVVIPQDEIKEALKNGTIDGFEFGSPAINWDLGFDNTITPYVTLPAWHQPSCMYDTIVNKDAWNQLPDNLKAIFESACKEVGMVDFVAHIEGANPDYLSRYGNNGMQVYILGDETMLKINEITDKICDDLAANDPFFARVLTSQRDFRASYRSWEKWGNYQLYPAKQD